MLKISQSIQEHPVLATQTAFVELDVRCDTGHIIIPLLEGM